MGDVDQVIANANEILSYIPQRPPMVMVDALLKADEKVYESQLTIAEDNLFLNKGYFLEAGLIENIAQTSAAGFGYNRIRQNKPLSIGFIGAVQHLKILSQPKIGDRLQTRVELIHEVMNISVVKGIIHNGLQTVAQCTMKLFLQE